MLLFLHDAPLGQPPALSPSSNLGGTHLLVRHLSSQLGSLAACVGRVRLSGETEALADAFHRRRRRRKERERESKSFLFFSVQSPLFSRSLDEGGKNGERGALERKPNRGVRLEAVVRGKKKKHPRQCRRGGGERKKWCVRGSRRAKKRNQNSIRSVGLFSSLIRLSVSSFCFCDKKWPSSSSSSSSLPLSLQPRRKSLRNLRKKVSEEKGMMRKRRFLFCFFSFVSPFDLDLDNKKNSKQTGTTTPWPRPPRARRAGSGSPAGMTTPSTTSSAGRSRRRWTDRQEQEEQRLLELRLLPLLRRRRPPLLSSSSSSLRSSSSEPFLSKELKKRG